jgi:hypothetical protein
MSLEHQWLHQLEEVKISSIFDDRQNQIYTVLQNSVCSTSDYSLRQPYAEQLLIQKRFYLYTYSFTTNSLYPSCNA